MKQAKFISSDITAIERVIELKDKVSNEEYKITILEKDMHIEVEDGFKIIPIMGLGGKCCFHTIIR